MEEINVIFGGSMLIVSKT
jgi:hypothetical protein